jgi:hypothetical protein
MQTEIDEGAHTDNHRGGDNAALAQKAMAVRKSNATGAARP